MSPKILLNCLSQLHEGRLIKSTHVTFPGTKPVTFRVDRDGQSQAHETTRKRIPDGRKRLYP